VRVAYTIEQCWHRVPGGTGVATLEMARALARRDDVELIGVAAAHRAPPPDAWAPPIPVAHHRLPRLALYEAWHRVRAPRVQRATGSVDVIHAVSLAMPPKSAPLVVTVHDLLFRHEPAHFTRRGVRFLTRGLELARRDADLVLCPSRATMNDCERAGFASSRLRLVPMGVDAAPASEEDVGAARARYGLDAPYLLWVGTIEPRKNLGRLLEAYRRADPDAELVLVGPTGWREDPDALVGDLKGRVRSLGFVPARELAALYAGARAFCFPSLSEGFGLPVLEAMAQGTPVVTSRGTSTEELAGDAAVLVDPLDVDSIEAGLEAVLTDEARRNDLIAKGKERVAAHTWEKTAELVAAAYAEVVAARSPATSSSGEQP
jgi:glycosyltransferase involved in cell wall biosynthesis